MKSILRLLSTIHYPLFTTCCLLLAGCGARDPFTYVQVSGKVTYEDGSLIPESLTITFHPESKAPDGKPCPRSAMAFVDKATGAIGSVTSYNVGDGLVRGKHKVTLMTRERAPLPPSIAPPEYGDLSRTPLEVDTAQLPFDLKVRKPR